MLDLVKKFFVRLTFAGVIAVPVLVASGCGGQGAGAGGAATAAGSSALKAKVVKMQMLLSKSSLNTSGTDSLIARVLVKDDSNSVVKDQVVKFSSLDNGIVIAPKSDKTDDKGWIEAEVTVIGKSNRSVELEATTTDLTPSKATGSFDVSGTKLTVAGPSSIVLSNSATYTLTLVDSLGGAIKDQAVTVKSNEGKSTVSVAGSGKTDAQGKVSITVVSTAAGVDSFEAAAAGATITQAYNIGSTDIQVVSASTEIPVSTSSNVTIVVKNGAQPAANVAVLVNSSRGTVSSSSVTTNSQGIATVSVSSAQAGPVIISATYDGSVGSSQIEFVSKAPSIVSLQASPSVVATNASRASANQNSTQLIARVRDVAGNPVKGVVVLYTLVEDISSGSIDSPGYAVTDSSGNASIAFKPGPNPSGPSQVRVRATVQQSNPSATPIQADTTLTAARQQLQVRIGRSNELLEVKTPGGAAIRLLDSWGVLVTDSAGAPVPNAIVTATVQSVAFRKGRFLPLVGDIKWRTGYNTTVTFGPGNEVGCLSEDANNNGALDASEDLNGDLKLTPGAVASVYFQPTATSKELSGTTDASGLAIGVIDYPWSWANWVKVRVRFTATVAGSEGFDDAEVWLLPTIESFKSDSPPNLGSPAGTWVDGDVGTPGTCRDLR